MHAIAFLQKRAQIWHCIISYCFTWQNMSLHNFLLFHLRSQLKNSCFVFHQGFQTPRNNKSTPPSASCFHLFLGVWNPWWKTCTRFWSITSHLASKDSRLRRNDIFFYTGNNIIIWHKPHRVATSNGTLFSFDPTPWIHLSILKSREGDI